jgi:hypothetical protein
MSEPKCEYCGHPVDLNFCDKDVDGEGYHHRTCPRMRLQSVADNLIVISGTKALDGSGTYPPDPADPPPFLVTGKWNAEQGVVEAQGDYDENGKSRW